MIPHSVYSKAITRPDFHETDLETHLKFCGPEMGYNTPQCAKRTLFIKSKWQHCLAESTSYSFLHTGNYMRINQHILSSNKLL